MKTKAYTDVEQSKKLAEILPLKSADMSYRASYRENGVISNYQATLCPFTLVSWIAVPCWSLSAMIYILPVGTELHKQSDGSISYYYVEVYNNKKYFSTKRYDNLIDACYEMICKLHEQKFI